MSTVTTTTTAVGDGSRTEFVFTFEYLQKSFVTVSVDGSTPSFTFQTAYTIQITPAPAVGAIVIIRRVTEKNELVTFVDGSVLLADDLNVAQMQALHVAVEAQEIAEGSFVIDGNGAYSAGDRRLTSLGTPTQPSDATNKNFVETSMTSQVVIATTKAAEAAASAVQAATFNPALFLLKAEAFGLGVIGAAPVLAAIDATTTASGTYRYTTGATGIFPSGVTAAVGGIIVMYRESATQGYMTLQPTGSTELYIRNLSTTWGAWCGIAQGRNLLINGNFDHWKRGASLAAATGIRYLSDRWFTASVGSTADISRQAFTLGQTAVPNSPEYYHRVVVASAAGASNAVATKQRVEFARTLAGQTVTLTFYAKSNAAKNMAVEFLQNFGTGGSPDVTAIGVATIALTTSWKKFTVTVAVPSIAGKTIGSQSSLDLNFFFEAGSNSNARTNSLGQQSGTFDLAQVQLEVGSVATPFEYRSVGEELALCQRYYCVTQATARFTATAAGNYLNTPIYWPVTMRVAPATTITGTATNTNSKVVSSQTTLSARFEITSAAAGEAYAISNEITADAEL